MRGVAGWCSSGRWVLVAVLVGVVWPVSGQAQLGGLKKLKQAVGQAAGGNSGAAAEPAAQGSPYNDYVLEIKPDVAACLERALAAENADLASYRTWAATARSPDQYDACKGALLTSPEGQALSADYMASLEGKEGQAAMDAMKAFAQKFEALTAKQCGPEPSQVDTRRREAQAAALEKGRAVCGYTVQQYQVLKERIPPICGSGALSNANGALKLPGDGTNLFWVYSATEVDVLKTTCGPLQSALKQQL